MSSMSKSISDLTIRLRDGRGLQAMEVGKSDGVPIFHFHGNGTSRLEVLIVAAAAERCGIRLIGLDRPGIGRSDAKMGYQLLDWPDDVMEVADQLSIERFAVEGLSGGGPFALACAYKIPHRLTGCTLIAPATGPFISKAGPRSLRVAVWMLTHLPWLVQALVRLSTALRGSDEGSHEKALLRNGARMGAADHALLEIPEIRKAFAKAIAEGSRQGADASTKDGMIFSRAWGFQVEEVTFKEMFLWQGEQDRVMSAAAARLLAEALPHCTATFYPNEGHLSMLVNHAQDIWQAFSAEREQSTSQ